MNIIIPDYSKNEQKAGDINWNRFDDSALRDSDSNFIHFFSR